MPNASRSRTIAAPALQLWDVISDPHHLPRWWPRVTRVEDVEDGAFTEVMKTRKGKLVRADFQLIESDEDVHRIMWEQQVQGTPFARVLRSAQTEVRLQADSARQTQVTIELRQVLNGVFPRLGSHMVRRAAQATLDEALDGLERIGG
jgi:uncharacterized protein YndB with AHSA1/START domain